VRPPSYFFSFSFKLKMMDERNIIVNYLPDYVDDDGFRVYYF
jgi:hypothetical protein